MPLLTWTHLSALWVHICTLYLQEALNAFDTRGGGGSLLFLFFSFSFCCWVLLLLLFCFGCSCVCSWFSPVSSSGAEWSSEHWGPSTSGHYHLGLLFNPQLSCTVWLPVCSEESAHAFRSVREIENTIIAASATDDKGGDGRWTCRVPISASV